MSNNQVPREVLFSLDDQDSLMGMINHIIPPTSNPLAITRSMSYNQEPREVFFPLDDQDSLMGMINHIIPPTSNPLPVWHSPPFSSIYLEEDHHEIGGYPNMIDDLSSFEAPSSLPLQQVNTSEISCLEKIVLHGLEKGQFSGTKRKQDSDSLDMQREEINEDGPKEDLKKQKRKYSAEEHNKNNRMRGQIFNEKLKTLRELIPKCTQSDKGSTVDEAIKYIKLLQYQLQEQQMMSRGVADSFSMPGGMQIPQFPHNYAMGYEMGMGYSMPNMGFLSQWTVATAGLTLPLPYYYYMPGNILPNPWTPTISAVGSHGEMSTMSHNASHGHTHTHNQSSL